MFFLHHSPYLSRTADLLLCGPHTSENWLITCKLRPLRPPDLNLCIYYLCGGIRNVCVNNKNSMQYSKWKCKDFNMRALSCMQKYFQKQQGLFRSWRSALQAFSMKWGKQNSNTKKWTPNSLKMQALDVIMLLQQLLCSKTHYRSLTV